MKLLIHLKTSAVQLLKFGERLVISSNILQGMWLLIHAEINDWNSLENLFNEYRLKACFTMF